MRITLIILTSLFFITCTPETTRQADNKEIKDTTKATEVTQTSNDPYIRMYEQGYRFYATGNEPFWNIAIDFEGDIFFSRLGEDDLHLPLVNVNQAQDANVVRYEGRLDGEVIYVTISQSLCNDTMSDQQKPFKVRINYTSPAGEINLEGCGNYLADPRIHNIWVVRELNGQALDQADFSDGLPRIELLTRDGRVHGFDGCNNFNGWFYIKDQEFYFGPFMSTLKACKNMDIGNQLTKLLHHARLSYSYEESALTLNKGDKSVVLAPVD